ncbi:DUF6484 domain-containing protein, partial [Corallococcus sicarius]|uniref:DUF6484 domain-containing protein n=1 Tax=Corallococcus sicarius TaxID=2316726 RepID=UPI001ABF1283
GWVVGFEPGRGVLVDYEGNPEGPLVARSTVPLESKALERAGATRQQAVLLFENGDPTRPLLMGLIHAMGDTPLLDALLDSSDSPRNRGATVDGRRVVIQGKDEIVLECGKASITLRRNGRVIIKGVQLESTATGNHRIRGGAVEIN